MGIVVSIIVLSILIFFHELGHFVAARFFGVHVEVFSIGFGKKLYTKHFGTTQWAISSIPLGGYVKMKGQNDIDPNERNNDSDSYNAKKPWQRIIILLAGPLANFLLAFLLYIIMAHIGLPRLLPVVGEISKESPAMAVLQKNDTITIMNGQKIEFWDEIGKIVEKNRNNTIILGVKRDNKVVNISIKPKLLEDENIFGEKTNRYMIGIAPLGTTKIVTMGLFESLSYASKQTTQTSLIIFQGVEKLITGAVDKKNVGGIISVVNITSKASNQGFIALLFFTALISINLGVLNLLPIPALDGGHIMFNLYEWVRGKALSENIVYKMTLIGWIILLGLMFLGLFNDINRIWG